MYALPRFIDEPRFVDLCAQHEVSQQFAQYLRRLIDYKVVLICDDSGSMRERTDHNETRWDELRRFVRTVFAACAPMQNSPLDVYFLNRPGALGVRDMEQIEAAFVAPPKGWTPIVPALRLALAQPLDATYAGRLFIVCTDGEPTNESGKVDTRQLRQVLELERGARDYVTFLACTDDEQAIGYLNRWDVEIKQVDVCDDYHSERKEVLAAQGAQFHFSFADYVVKVLMGAVVPELDQLDEKRPMRQQSHATYYDERKPSAKVQKKDDCVLS